MAVFLGGATALLPIYARDILQTGPWGLGLLRSSGAIGALSMAIWLSRHPLRGGVGRLDVRLRGIYGAATIVFGFAHTFAVSLVALAFMGAADMVSVVIRLSLVQLATPDAMRGRVGAVNSMFIGASNQLGEFESGVTAAWFGPSPPSSSAGSAPSSSPRRGRAFFRSLRVSIAWMAKRRPLPQSDRFDVAAANAHRAGSDAFRRADRPYRAYRALLEPAFGTQLGALLLHAQIVR